MFVLFSKVHSGLVMGRYIYGRLCAVSYDSIYLKYDKALVFQGKWHIYQEFCQLCIAKDLHTYIYD
jgi:hypothetical protein